MVRNIVGCLVYLCSSNCTISNPHGKLKDIIHAKSRHHNPYPPLPAHGLYLVDVHYDTSYQKKYQILEKYISNWTKS